MRLGFRFGLFLLWFANHVTNIGYWFFRRNATADERLALINKILRPVGLEVTSATDAYQQATDSVNDFLARNAKQLGGGYGN